MPERPQPSRGHALERTPAGDGGRRDLGRQCSPVLGPQHHHASPNLAVAVLGGHSGPGSVPGAPAPSDPGPQATPSPSRPHWATGTRGVGGPDLGHPETASQAVPRPQEGVSGGDSGGVVSTKRATALSPVPLTGLGGCTGVPSRTQGNSPAHLRDLVWALGWRSVQVPPRCP